MYNYKEILDKKYIGFKYTITDPYDYDTFIWGEMNIQKPSKEFLETKIDSTKSRIIKEIHEKRISEYPPIEDYIDGVVKGDQSQIQAYIDACLAVKLKYPKPE